MLCLKMFFMNMGKVIRDLRKEHKITQSQLAEAINSTQDTISLWELNKSCPDAFYIVKLAKYFSVSADYLLGLQDVM